MPADDSRRISMLMGLLFGLAGMGSSSAAIALPLLGEDLGVSQGVATWTISLYVLMLAVTTAVYGRISDLVGIRIPLLIGVVLMTTGALVAALAPTYSVLLVARLFQGAGAAAVPTLGVAVLNGRYAGQIRGLALGRLAGVAAAVSSLGPLLGGGVEHLFGWRAVMALPVLGLLVIPFVWHALTGEGTGARLDILGAILVAVTAAGAVLIIQSPSTGLIVTAVGVTLMLFGTPATAARVRRRPDGFLPLTVIRNGTVVRSAFAAAAVPAAWFALLVGVPVVLLGDGWEPYEVGLVLLPSAAIALFVPRVTGPLMNRVGTVWSLAISSMVATLALLFAAAGAALISWPLLAVSVILVTFAFGLGQPALSATVADAVEPEVRGVALGVATLIFLIGGSVGSALVGGLGSVTSIGLAFLVLAVLPVLGTVIISPDLRNSRPNLTEATEATPP
ncbi:DHA2 family efflux MFS transporter permease subunit [Nocardioides salsibiostraticola]